MQRAVEDIQERLKNEVIAAHALTQRIAGPPDGSSKSIIRTRRNAEADDSAPADKAPGSSSGNSRQRNGSKRSTLQSLEASLSEEAIREDFVAIVRDTDARAETFASKYQKVCENLFASLRNQLLPNKDDDD